jgi:predicted ferric reductase
MQKLKLNKGWIIVFLLLTIPILLWIITPKIDFPFSSLQNSLASLGEIFGLLGIVMFSINFILATRLHFIEKLFNGLNNVYKKHAFLGQLAFILLLFHPLLLLTRYASNFKEAFSFLFLSDLWARNFGIFALWMMIFLIILTLYLKPKYNIWKITHKFFGLALFFGALHVYLIPSYIMNNPILKIYVLGFAILGLVAFFYKTVFGNYLIKKYSYVVESIKRLNENIIEISLKPKDEHIQYNPGQFIFISFKQKNLSHESHPFSISSSPGEELLKVTIKSLGDFTEELITKLCAGTLVELERPYGTFSYFDCKNKNQIWIAGGIGVTPFISFAKNLKNLRDYSIKLFYSVNNKNEAVYLDLLKSIENEPNNNFSVIPFYSDEQGYIDADYVASNINDININEIFICAPPKMIEKLRSDFIKNGINEDTIHSEEFNF